MKYSPPEFLKKPRTYFPKRKIDNEKEKKQILEFLKENPSSTRRIALEIKKSDMITKRLLVELEEENEIIKQKSYCGFRWFLKKDESLDFFLKKNYVRQIESKKGLRSGAINYSEIEQKIFNVLESWDVAPTTNQISREIKLSAIPTSRILKRMKEKQLISKEVHGGPFKKISYWYLN